VWCIHHLRPSDASGSWGCGTFISSGKWFMLQWPRSWADFHITVLSGVHIPGKENGLADALSHNNPNLSDFFCSTGAVSHTSRVSLSAVDTTTRLHVTELDTLLGKLFAKSLADSTRRSYGGSQKQIIISVRKPTSHLCLSPKKCCVTLPHS